MDFLSSTMAGWLSIFMMSAGVGGIVFLSIQNEDSFLNRGWTRYLKLLDKEIRFLLLRRTSQWIAARQFVALAATLVLYQLTQQLLLGILALMIIFAPYMWLKSKHTERVVKLEQQLDGWLLLLSNSLKATPAIGEAIKSTVNLVQPPISEELDLLVKENQLGTPLDKAILNASERINSTMVSGSLSMLVVARQTGGDLPTILETSAGSLREMARLEGVVRTKTAEGKGQVYVLGVMPWLMAGLLSNMDEEWWPTLSQQFTGNIILVVSFLLWFFALVWGRNILSVDI